MNVRQFRLDAALNDVVRLASLRRPQRQALERFHKVMSNLGDDLPNVAPSSLSFSLREEGFDVPQDGTPFLLFDLATGVGKTRLMGAIAAYLWRAGQSQNILLLAPRRTILEKFERESDVNSEKYLFVDAALVPQPNTVFRSSIESFQSTDDERLNLFVLSPQSITGDDRRFSRPTELSKLSAEMHLTKANDVVVLIDESHHLGTSAERETRAWRQAVDKLRPKLCLGFSATHNEQSTAQVVYSYDLATCLREGLYTKRVSLVVNRRDEQVTDEEWDHSTLRFALDRLDRKTKALEAYADAHQTFPRVQPVLLICAKDTQHADDVAHWLTGTVGLSEDELIVTHSERAKTEDDIARLLAIDSEGSRIRVVVNVFELTEGWDVTNVFVIAPLRSMATFQNAVQSMGRGLRLVGGQRVGDEDVDTLDVLCFGRETLEGILTAAIEQFGDPEKAGVAIEVSTPPEIEDRESEVATKHVFLRTVREVTIPIPVVHSIPPEPNLAFDAQSVEKLMATTAYEFDLAKRSAKQTGEGVTISFDTAVRLMRDKIIADLPYLSAPLHSLELEQLIRRLLSALGAEPGEPLRLDWARMSAVIRGDIDKHYRSEATRYECREGAEEVVVLPARVRVPEDFAAPAARVPVREWR